MLQFIGIENAKTFLKYYKQEGQLVFRTYIHNLMQQLRQDTYEHLMSFYRIPKRCFDTQREDLPLYSRCSFHTPSSHTKR